MIRFKTLDLSDYCYVIFNRFRFLKFLRTCKVVVLTYRAITKLENVFARDLAASRKKNQLQNLTFKAFLCQTNIHSHISSCFEVFSQERIFCDILYFIITLQNSMLTIAFGSSKDNFNFDATSLQ